MWRNLIICLLVAIAIAASMTTPAWVQGPSGVVSLCYGPPTACVRVDSGTPLPVTGGGGGGGAVTIASGGVASGAYASGSIASGAFASGALASGSVASGAFALGALASGSIAAGAQVDLLTMRGTKAPGTAAANSALTGCVYTAAGITLTDGQQAACQLTSTGGQLVSVVNANSNGIKTPTLSSPVVQAGMQYETVAASQTGQSLGATGATGDYLSHCVVYPTTTTPGVVTVFDNASAAGTNAIAFPGGASSVSNLVPFAIPVGAFSAAGAWKVTTGANLVVTCYGNFT